MAVAVRAVLIILLLLALLLGVGAVVLTTLDWNAHRGTVASLIERFTDWEVAQLGGLEVDLWSPLTVRVENFALRDTTGESAVDRVSGELAEITLSPLSVLHGRLQIQALTTRGTELMLRTPAEAPEPPEEEQLPYIGRAEIERARIVYTPHAGESREALINQLTLTGSAAAERLQVAGGGEVEGLPFTLSGELGLDPDDGSRPVPITLAIDLAGVTIEIDGEAASAPAFDLGLLVHGGDPRVIASAFGVALGEVPPYRFEGRVAESAGKLLLPSLQVALGDSDIRGEMMIDTERDQPLIQARLVADRIRHADLMALLPPEAAQEEVEQAQAEEEPPPDRPRESPHTPLFSDEPFELGMLRSFDAEVELAVEEYVGGSAGRALQRIKLEGRLEQGRLTIKPFEVSVADGTLGVALLFDASDDLIEAQADIAATGIDLTTLVAPFVGSLDPTELIQGDFSTKTELTTRGSSPRQMVQQLNGGVVLAMEEGAITQSVVEAAGLDVPEALVKWFSEQPLTAIQCAIGIIDIDNGAITIEQMLLATPDSNVVAEGGVDLAQERIDLTLQAHAKDVSFGAGDNPIRFTGPLNDMNVDLVSGRLAASLVGSALLAVINPLLSVLPLFESGEAQGSRCEELDAELRRIVRASEAQAEQSSAGAESEANQP